MPKTFNYKRTDSEAVFRVNADLTGSTVRVQVRLSGQATPLPDLTSAVTNAPKGEITVDISGLDSGVYALEIEQTQAGKKVHYPNKGYDKLVIEDDLDAV